MCRKSAVFQLISEEFEIRIDLEKKVFLTPSKSAATEIIEELV
jgi:hypothetical protein